MVGTENMLSRPAHHETAPAALPVALPSTLLLAVLLALAPPPAVLAEVNQRITVEATHAVTRGEDDEALAVGTGLAELDMRSAGSRYVRGRLQLRARIQNTDPVADLEVPRAFVKARFPLTEESYFHLTAGRARLTWGDGAFYNAGDTLFGALGDNPDFTAETIRDETGWLAAAFVPLGRFAFVEPVVLVPLPEGRIGSAGIGNAGAGGATEAPDPSAAHDTSAGARIQGKLGEIKSEASYLFRGTESYHQPAVSLQGNLGIDWYAGATTRIPGPDSRLRWDGAAEAAREEAAASFGLLHIEEGTSRQSLTLRIEGLVRPWKEWSEIDARFAHAAAEGESAGPAAATAMNAGPYGLELFGEVVWQPAQTLQFYLRQVASPIDASGLFVPGAAWMPHDGLTLSLFAALQAGEVSDVYGWERAGGSTLATSIRYVY
ncbi:MAG: hypothetical protein GVY23_04790 [Spirochaetes bacterium]|jgi:hypothetical protein|nr:hypothetical protein [Spirochaetota bacterium]